MGNNTNTTRRIYVACLASYNAGTLHGAWIETEGKDADELQAEVSAMLRASPEPNVMVACPDCDGSATVAELGDPAYTPCATCNGRGTVPSAEEYAIHDHEGFPKGTVGEYTSLREIAELEEAFAEADERGAGEAFLALLGHLAPSELDYARRLIEDGYQGEHDNLAAYAEQFCEDCGYLSADLPDLIRNHIDWEGMGRDFELGGDVFAVESGHGTVYVFSTNV